MSRTRRPDCRRLRVLLRAFKGGSAFGLRLPLIRLLRLHRAQESARHATAAQPTRGTP